MGDSEQPCLQLSMLDLDRTRGIKRMKRVQHRVHASSHLLRVTAFPAICDVSRRLRKGGAQSGMSVGPVLFRWRVGELGERGFPPYTFVHSRIARIGAYRTCPRDTSGGELLCSSPLPVGVADAFSVLLAEV